MIWAPMRERKRDTATIRTGAWLSTERYEGAVSLTGSSCSLVLSVTRVHPDYQATPGCLPHGRPRRLQDSSVARNHSKRRIWCADSVPQVNRSRRELGYWMRVRYRMQTQRAREGSLTL